MIDPHPHDKRFDEAKHHFLVGLGHYEAGRFADALHAFQASLTLLPGRLSTLINLAATQLQLGQAADALRTADAALLQDEASIDAWLHRGHALAQLARPLEALAAFDRLIALDKALPSAWTSRGNVLRELARHEQAAASFREAMRLGGDAHINGYYLAAVEQADAVVPDASRIPPSPPRVYVESLFDSYAQEFDQHLTAGLHYDAPRQLVDAVVAAAPGQRFGAALDLGCGTGLCGPLLRPHALRLVGVDLSSGMLDKARTLNVYDQLVHDELQHWLDGCHERFDLVLAADVFIYVGALEGVFAGLRRVLNPSGMFAFTLECPSTLHEGMRLMPSLRYAHSWAYVDAIARDHRLHTVSVHDAPVRIDQGEPVRGLYVLMRA